MKEKIINNTKGFTMAELVISLCIITLLAAASVPIFTTVIPDYKLKSAARDLYSNFRKAKRQAIKENTSWAIVFDTVNGCYYICSDQGANGTWGDGGANIAEMTNDTLNGATNVIELTVTLNDYGYGVRYGHGPATFDATAAANPFPNDLPTTNITYAVNDDIVTFNPRGGGKAGYIYLSNQNNTSAYAVGTGASGVVYLRRWMGAANGWN